MPHPLFPHLEESELRVLNELFVAWEKKTPDFSEKCQKFLSIMEGWVGQYFYWQTLPDIKVQLRKKLLNVSGIWNIIPPDDHKNFLQRVLPFNKKPITDIKVDSPYQHFAEVPIFDLKFMPGLSDILGSVVREEEITFLDYVAGNREKMVHPVASLVVFRDDLSQELVTPQYVTASAELVTKTILINPFKADKTERDMVTIAFDIVFESAILDYFHHDTVNFDADMLSLKGKMEACRFLSQYLTQFAQQLIQQGHEVLVNFLKKDVLMNQMQEIDRLMAKFKNTNPKAE